MDKHLKDRQYYIDLYDRFTVDQCRREEELLSKIEPPEVLEGEPVDKHEAKRARDYVAHLSMYCITGERYSKKEETIREWMQRDQAKDRFLESTSAPENIRCKKCLSLMNPKNKHLWDHDGKERVLFMYDCPRGCLPRRALYNDGEEWVHKPPVCTKCSKAVEETEKKEGNVITTTLKCLSCGHVDTDTLDLSPKEEKVDEKFEKDRARFCLSDKDGAEYSDFKYRMKGIQEIMDKQKEKEREKDVYDKVAQLQKLTLLDLEKLIIPPLEQAGYLRFQFGTPEMGRDLYLPFTTQDSKSDRVDRFSELELTKLIKKTLENTNWRLMSDGIQYRLGILTGKLRAYEREEDLVNLVKGDFKFKPKSETPPDKAT